MAEVGFGYGEDVAVGLVQELEGTGFRLQVEIAVHGRSHFIDVDRTTVPLLRSVGAGVVESTF